MKSRFYTAQEVAEMLGVHQSTAYKIIKLKCDERAKDRIFELSYKIHMPEESIRRLRAERRRSELMEQIK